MATFTVETGAGLSDATSYASLADANTYHERPTATLNAAWAAASDADKELALIWATRVLDEQVEWSGYRASTAQALGWPRSDVWNRWRDASYEADEMPAWLAQATAELAAFLLATDRTAEGGRDGIAAMSVGPLALTYRTDQARQDPYVLPRSVRDMVAPFAAGFPRESASDGLRIVWTERV